MDKIEKLQIVYKDGSSVDIPKSWFWIVPLLCHLLSFAISIFILILAQYIILSRVYGVGGLQ